MPGYFGNEDEEREMFSTIGGGYYYPEADLFLPDIDPEDPNADVFDSFYGEDDFIERDLYADYDYPDYHYPDYE